MNDFDLMQLKIANFIKNHLKRKNLTYQQLSIQTKLPLSTIKRWLSKGGFSMAGLNQILNIIGIEWWQLFEGINKGSNTPAKRMNPQQEEFIVAKPKSAYILLLLSIGHSLEGIKKCLSISNQQLESILLELDRNKFIEYSQGRVSRFLIQLPISWSRSGAFSKRFFKPSVNAILGKVVWPNSGFSNEFNSSVPLVRVFELYLSKKSFILYKTELLTLISKYLSICKQELLFDDVDSLKPISTMVAVDELRLWEEVMWK